MAKQRKSADNGKATAVAGRARDEQDPVARPRRARGKKTADSAPSAPAPLNGHDTNGTGADERVIPDLAHLADEPPAQEAGPPASSVLPPPEEEGAAPPASGAEDDRTAARAIASAIQEHGGSVTRQGRMAILHDLAAITGEDYHTGREGVGEGQLRGLTLDGFIAELRRPGGGRVGELPRVGSGAIQELLRVLAPSPEPIENAFPETPPPAPRRRGPRKRAAALEKPAEASLREQAQQPAEPFNTWPVKIAVTVVDDLSPASEKRFAQLEQLWTQLVPSAQRAVLHYAAMLAVEA